MSINIHVKSGQNKWDVSVETYNTILQLKEEIAKVSDIPADNQRLIYSGKILKNDQTVESYNMQDDHSIHLVKSGGAASSAQKSNSSNTASEGTNSSAAPLPSSISAGQSGGFNPLADLTGARYAGYANLPSADMFGPDGGMNSAPNQEDMLRMMDNPMFQSQMNEMLSNPQMLDFMIQSNPQLQAMGPQARQMFQSPFFRQMLTNPDMIRQSMQMARMMGGEGANNESSFPAPGETGTDDVTAIDSAASINTSTQPTPSAAVTAAGNPFAALLNPGMNPFASMLNNPNGQAAGGSQPAFDPSMLASMFQAPAPVEQDNRPPEERYESQLRQLNDMGFFEFDRNVAALRRSGGSVQGALDALLNDYV